MSATPEQSITNAKQVDVDPVETKEWLEALNGVIAVEGTDRAAYLIDKQIEFARVNGVVQPFQAETPYINTIPVEHQVPLPGNQAVERTIRAYTRWNAMAMVLRANEDSNVGGHISSFQSAATLYDIGYNHFWHAPSETHGGDLIYVQGHCAPGIYSRAFLLGRLTEEELINFRQEVDGKGISSYPHPWLMPDFWQFPTVSMGLGPIMAIYQARFMKYMQTRELIKTEPRKVWAFLGDGETDEPESLGAIGMAGREKLDNLIFVINCNLQRLDGPVRGNGSIIQELESEFRGAGWNVIKVIWGRHWDILFARDKKGLLMKRLGEIVDGEYQTFRSKNGAYIREHVFNTPELQALVADWSDEDVWNLNRGGHDVHKVYAAYHQAVNHTGQPTVILAKTVKGYWMGSSGQAMNIAHQQKHMSDVDVKAFRDHFKIPVTDDQLHKLPFVKFAENSPEMNYMRARRNELGGYLPQRRKKGDTLKVPGLDAFASLLEATTDARELSTTMAFVRILNILLKDKEIGKRIVPIVPDESRTFGMEGLFRQLGIWNQMGQLYTPQDKDQLMFYREDKKGQVLQEGINEAGAMSDWIAAATAYSTHGVAMIPFFIFYSMFGFQRVGDLCWAAGDMRSRGFLLGGTSGRTTLNGEGLQHEDGHSHLWSATIPNCISYDPTFSFELAVILQDGLKRMYQDQEDVFYYITVMNENYPHPGLPKGEEKNILKGMYQLTKSKDAKLKVQLLGSGTIFREVIAASEMLRNDWGVESDIWGCPSFTELGRDWNTVSRNNLLNPEGKMQISHVEACLKDTKGPVIAATDYIRMFAEQIRPAIQNAGKRYSVLGTDGFGRSDTREKLRHFFEVDRKWVTIAALKALADEGQIEYKKVSEAIKKYGIDPKKPNPLTV
ncbi:MAG: pyruvate dehydrogenase (acetyl-transferring), homodimeric type [Leptospiraceae bacterium]|nr:pyruvate dehydrogenase (acetyl-transferring), homodimeric type [Leptospiraceae bacterium]MBK9499339.1 pyruvate dehydrogenase (acetyl-transferring), homodimeric type [Leptospiraceae bacterium]MBL0266087.1 pyruvate dehydrogenase (acetyl-transferring), homodimeric type [Leptospiraceae bacterium]